MPNGRIPPTTDLALQQWAGMAGELLTEMTTEFGISGAQSAEFSLKKEAYIESLARATAEATRGPLATAIKRAKKAELLRYSRDLVRFIGGNPAVSLEHRLELGLQPRKPGTPTQPPTQAPDLDKISQGPTVLTFRVHNNNTVSRRRRPAGVAGAAIWTWTGTAPPADPKQWNFAGNYTKQIVTIDFGIGIQPGTKVWVAAYWYSKLGQYGPVSVPLEVRLGGTSLAEQGEQNGESSITQVA